MMYKIFGVVFLSLLGAVTVAGEPVQKEFAQVTGISVRCAQALFSTDWDESDGEECLRGELRKLTLRCKEVSPTTLRCNPTKDIQITFSARGRIIDLLTPAGHKTF